MYIQVKNENLGYVVSTYGNYVVVGNPAITRYSTISASEYYTGSIDLFKYNYSTDQHDYIGTYYKPWIEIPCLLSRESDNNGMQTELSGTFGDRGLLIDKDRYTGSYEDGFGLSLDMYDKFLLVGCPYYSEFVKTNAVTFTQTGSFAVLYDLSIIDPNYTGSLTSASVYTFDDPAILLPSNITNSFGKSVSINKDWIVIGSPQTSGSNGIVYIYQNQSTGSNYSWQLYQKLEIPNTGSLFGYSLKLDKGTTIQNPSLVVGCGNNSIAKVYYYEFISGSWRNTYVFTPDYSIYPLTFNNYAPYNPILNTVNGFGHAVSIYNNTVIIGEYLDRTVYEYPSSPQFQQGSVYIFERCPNNSFTNDPLFKQSLKTYGTNVTLKNNYLGMSVDIFNDKAVAGMPKNNAFSLNSCYLGGTLSQLHYCEGDLSNYLCGQALFLQKNTASGDWEVLNTFQKKKKYLSPYKNYGFSVALADKSMVVGAPMNISNEYRQINIETTQSGDVTLDDVSGKAYIYNLNNLRSQFHVGNVFYRNGKIVIMTSGSIFDGLFYNPNSTYTYEYDLQFKGQHTIFEKQIVCNVNPGEFNVSTNPTAIEFPTSSLDVNGNGKFDYQDLDIVLQYMQYKNTTNLGLPISTDWSSSLVSADDEISLLNYYHETYVTPETPMMVSESILKWESSNMSSILDFNQDNKVDIKDMTILWKFFTRRLTQTNYNLYTTPACKRKLYSDVIDYINDVTKLNAVPKIKTEFFNYDYNSNLDKTGSYLAPYVTTIGLYSGLDLCMVAKLGTPIKLIPNFPINFIVKMDY